MRILISVIITFALTGMVEAKKNTSKRNTPAKQLFGNIEGPAPMKPRAIGGYAKGCLAGAERLPANGSGWQTMRLSRNRNWGHPELIDFIERFSLSVKKGGWPGLLVGDLSQPRGGPMLTGHASHQLGLDADIWFKQMPEKKLSNKARENVSAVSMIKSRSKVNPKTWNTGHAKLLRKAASDKAVARIFVHPSIKKAMCDWSKKDKERSWLRKLRPWYGHHYHFHVRLACPKGSRGCKNQAPPPPGPGCGKKLAWWLSDKPYRKATPKKKPAKKIKKKRPMRLADLPKPCSTVLNSSSVKQAAADQWEEPDI